VNSDASTTLEGLRPLMEAAGILGMSIAVLHHGKVDALAALGVRDTLSNEPVNTQTVFQAASLTKPMVAYAALQLVDAGALALDESLAYFVPTVLPGDAAFAAITARHLLTHTCGLPNLRSKNQPLQMHFQPGAWFSYSSVGFGYLQTVMAAITGEPLEATMQRLVFEPLGMQSSSLEQQARYQDNFAMPHEGETRVDVPSYTASASFSLQTTAADYGAFLGAVLRGERLKEATHRAWLACHVHVPKEDAERLHSPPTAAELESDVGWGLGWGLEPNHGTFFQWGKMDGTRAFTMGSVAEQSAVVLFTNSNKGLRLMREAAACALPGAHPAIRWLDACVSE
jgi:CubicO group peptidase (beta-lactamase class C family)